MCVCVCMCECVCVCVCVCGVNGDVTMQLHVRYAKLARVKILNINRHPRAREYPGTVRAGREYGHETYVVNNFYFRFYRKRYRKASVYQGPGWECCLV